MNVSQKFEELSDALSVCVTWLDEAEPSDSPYIRAAEEMLSEFVEMLRGDARWESCFQVKSRIEERYPGADL